MFDHVSNIYNVLIGWNEKKVWPDAFGLMRTMGPLKCTLNKWNWYINILFWTKEQLCAGDKDLKLMNII